jgi:hypothetical protein
MLSLATTNRDLPKKSPYRKVIVLFAGTIFSAHLRTLVYPRISSGVGHDPKFREAKGNLFIGYFQSHRISSSVRELLINALDKIELKQSRDKESSSDALIHVRVGDYKSEPTFGVLSSEYFSSALQLLEMEGPVHGISVFSDEPEIALKVIPSNFVDRVTLEENPEESPLITLCRMRGYKSYILANSTFSWWAAYTSEATSVYVPDPWFVTGENPVDLIPENWTRAARS